MRAAVSESICPTLDPVALSDVGACCSEAVLRALVAQWIEHLTTDQKVGRSSRPERAEFALVNGVSMVGPGSSPGLFANAC